MRTYIKFTIGVTTAWRTLRATDRATVEAEIVALLRLGAWAESIEVVQK